MLQVFSFRNYEIMKSIYRLLQTFGETIKYILRYCVIFVLTLAFFLTFHSCHQKEGFEDTNDTPRLIPEGFISVAHRGVHSKGVPQNSTKAFLNAKLAGFDYGETDIQWTKDNIPVCCHDNYFNDNKEKIIISEHTLSELKNNYYYYGIRISTLEEVMEICKEIGLGLYLDHFDYFEGEKKERIYSLISHFGKEKIGYLFGNLNRNGIDQVLSFDPKATIVIVGYSQLNAQLIQFANEIKTDSNKVILDLPYVSNPIDVLLAQYRKLKKGVGYGVWTLNDRTIYSQYRPYMECITSDSISY